MRPLNTTDMIDWGAQDRESVICWNRKRLASPDQWITVYVPSSSGEVGVKSYGPYIQRVECLDVGIVDGDAMHGKPALAKKFLAGFLARISENPVRS